MRRRVEDIDGPRMDGRAWAMLLCLSALWGSSFFFFKIMVTAWPPLTVALARVGVSALILHVWLALRGDRMPATIGRWIPFVVMGLLNNVIPFALIAFGETRIASGLASILNATTPIFTVVAAHWLTTDERLTASKGAGLLAGLFGVAVLVGPDAFAGLGSEGLAGYGACLLAAASYAFAGLYGRRFRGEDPIEVATGQLTGSTLLLVPASAIVDHPWTLATPGLQVWGATIAIALLCTVAAYILYFRILAAAGATNLLLVTFLLPVSATSLGWLVLGETLAPRAVVGMAIIAIGLAAIDGRLVRALRARIERFHAHALSEETTPP